MYYLVTLTSRKTSFTALCQGNPSYALSVNGDEEEGDHFTITMVHPMTEAEFKDAKNFTSDDFYDDDVSLFAMTPGMPKQSEYKKDKDEDEEQENTP